MGRKLTTEEFIHRATEIHRGTYDYSMVNYVCSHCPVQIGCSEHGWFEQSPNAHLCGKGCRKCSFLKTADHRRIGLDEFIRRAVAVHGDRYGYQLVEYSNSKTPVTIVCSEHGEFKQTPDGHLVHGCEACSYKRGARKKPVPFDEFVERARSIHGDRYDYHPGLYCGLSEKTIVTCREHGDWVVDAGCHANRGHGCPRCRKSHGEVAIERWLTENGIEFKSEVLFQDLGLLRFDFYLPKHNLLIEFDGKQHFKAMSRFGGKEGLAKCQERDERKNRWAWENGYMLMRIPYWMKDRIPELLHRQLTLFTVEAA